MRMLVAGVGLLYLGALVGFTVGFANDVPVGAWVGFGIVAAVVALIAIATIALFERAVSRAGTGSGVAPSLADGRERVLVVADVGCEGTDACPTILARIRDRSSADVLVIAPTIASPLHHLTDDEDRERASAGRRLDEIISLLKREGVEAQGMIGSDLPLEAIHDALAAFPADEIVILAPSADSSSWSEHDLVERARVAFSRPVTHVPVARAQVGSLIGTGRQ